MIFVLIVLCFLLFFVVYNYIESKKNKSLVRIEDIKVNQFGIPYVEERVDSIGYDLSKADFKNSFGRSSSKNYGTRNNIIVGGNYNNISISQGKNKTVMEIKGKKVIINHGNDTFSVLIDGEVVYDINLRGK